ncbi:DUF1127 domain-containing protein [Palleronia abyssalis]|uniref:YjiS-like domain-containing protein n=1 Tax=Palleronia abyssalis TaxID=1501240 RepID=A0A2R8BUI8_9RHOB|nr:DUF1127 domain-containing protein [Palleronia abyssalis]SPJ23837.1 hypothetical protein PAA8504_01655 [Palleronia abyssalis]
MSALSTGMSQSRPARRLALNNPLHFWELYRQRRQLASLDAHLLRDLGIAPAARDAEVVRPAWDAPAHWMK